jgi:hypothetical protein
MPEYKVYKYHQFINIYEHTTTIRETTTNRSNGFTAVMALSTNGRFIKFLVFYYDLY